LPIRKTGEVLAFEGTIVEIKEDSPAIGYILDRPVFEAYHKDTKETVCITCYDIKEQVTTSAVAIVDKPLLKKKKDEDDIVKR
jgi:hypothetical protein